MTFDHCVISSIRSVHPLVSSAANVNITQSELSAGPQVTAATARQRYCCL